MCPGCCALLAQQSTFCLTVEGLPSVIWPLCSKCSCPTWFGIPCSTTAEWSRRREKLRQGLPTTVIPCISFPPKTISLTPTGNGPLPLRGLLHDGFGIGELGLQPHRALENPMDARSGKTLDSRSPAE